MEFPSSSKDKGAGYWASLRSQMEGISIHSPSEDLFNNFGELMNFDTYAGWCSSPSVIDQMLPSYAFSLNQSMSLPMDVFNFTQQTTPVLPLPNGSVPPPAKLMDTQFRSPLNSVEEDDSSCQKKKNPDMGNSSVPRLIGQTLAEKMLRALSLFKESSGGGILAQVWVPIKHGDQYVLSTFEQPYLLDQMLAGYREVSRAFTFSAEVKPGSCPGLPGRVFTSKLPEWTSNVVYYNKDEYLRVQHAVNHEVRGSIALPVFEGDPLDMSCCAVLELVTMKERQNFDAEMENVCSALQAVNLRSIPPSRIHPQCFSMNQRAALAEITDVLRAVCHAHRLPLALTWIPCGYAEGIGDEMVRVHARGHDTSSDEKCVLCVEDTACYANDGKMQGFVHACREHYLEEGQGIVGKALQSNQPFFFPDVKGYDIIEYPLVHHARKFGLNASVAIRLRSTYTGDDDYILEFFLPVNMKGSTEQQLLLNNLSGTMQRMCRSLRTLSDAELIGYISKSQKGLISNFPSVSLSRSSSEHASFDRSLNSNDEVPSNVSDSTSTGLQTAGPRDLITSGSRRPTDKKRSTAEKNVSLSILQQYFSGSLKDAAKSLGVCPTTLKRICRQHGISRWPSRKINKVNRSLKKIQTVLDSVQGVEGGLKFDPTTGGILAAGSIIQEFDTGRGILFSSKTFSSQNTESSQVATTSCSDGPVKLEQYSSMLLSDLSDNPRLDKGGSRMEHSLSCLMSSSSIAAADAKMNSENGVDGENGIFEHHNRASSGITDSSNGSGSTSSPSCDERKHSMKRVTSFGDALKITVKATYKEDTIRFKFDPRVGCFQLHEEVATRFKLQTGTFQLKYLDDEEEWVLLESDSDLGECLEILEFVGSSCMKLLVRDFVCAMGSSGGSNSILRGGS